MKIICSNCLEQEIKFFYYLFICMLYVCKIYMNVCMQFFDIIFMVFFFCGYFVCKFDYLYICNFDVFNEYVLIIFLIIIYLKEKMNMYVMLFKIE